MAAKVLTITALAALAGCGSAKASSGSAPPTHTQSTTSTPASTLADQEQSWLDGPGGQAFLTLKNDLQQFTTDATTDVGTGDYSSVLADCQVMQTDSIAALQSAQNPDSMASIDIEAAYGDIEAASGLCVTGINYYNSGDTIDSMADIQDASSYMAEATTQIKAATAAIQQDGGATS